LDCTRYNPPPHFNIEDEKLKNLRLAAQWESDCAFEAGNGWIADMNKIYGVGMIYNYAGDVMQTDDEN